MSLSHFHDTIVAISTAEARSALGIVRISGPDSIRIVANVVSEPELIWVARGGSSIYTAIKNPDVPQTSVYDPAAESQTKVYATPGAFIDDVVIHIYRSPRSFTGEDLCEITSHGSPLIERRVLSALISAGAREAEPGEFSRRAFFNGKISFEDAELIVAKANSSSSQELRGAELAIYEKFARLRSVYDKLIALIALVDAEIDFGDSDQIKIKDFTIRVDEVTTLLETLMRDSTTRRENAGYFTVALTGPPNVGKSSIFNALLNFERSIVSDIPGTTRDYVEAFIDVDGFRVKLVDTAGIRSSEETLEQRGIALGSDAARHADISLRVTDPSDRTPFLDYEAILLHNKIDLDGWRDSLHISALTGTGIEELHVWLSNELKARSSDLNRININSSERMKLESVIARLKLLSIDLEPALLAEDLRSCIADLSSLLGMNVNSDSLDYIFGKMCIGK